MMTTTLTKEDMIKELATNECQAAYISELNENFVFEMVSNTMSFIDQPTFQDVLDQALDIVIVNYDYKTEELTDKQMPSTGLYNLLHFGKGNWNITMNNVGYVTATISMPNEHYIIMQLLGTLDEMINAIYDYSVADEIIITDMQGEQF